ncbi:hypothetical protein ACJIZ3_015655 [Penstemon smallii]|uniref:Protein kinase domain-containing protein n=1 Tax=Penstemon smallii TaxID=265156 RepID=A0ABD3RQE8_9LAMI
MEVGEISFICSMECLGKKRKGVCVDFEIHRSHFSLEDYSRKKKKCKEVVVSKVVDLGRTLVNEVATAPASGTTHLDSPSRGLKRKIGCIDTATQLGRKNKIEQEYELTKTLGKGKFGSVVICRSRATGEEFACKTLLKGEEIVHREVEMMQHLSGHSGIVTLKAVYEDAESFHLVMELCSGGRLLDQMTKEGVYSEHKAANVIKELMLAIRYCHEMGVVHRDIKPENILLTSTGQMKLADFGLAVRILDGQSLSGIVGSPAYVAPEVLVGNYSEKVDIWSAGVLLHALLVGVLPFKGNSLDAIFDAIKKENLDFSGGMWDSVSRPARDLLSGMLTRSSSTRLTATDVLRHPWISFYTERTPENLTLEPKKDHVRLTSRQLTFIHGLESERKTPLRDDSSPTLASDSSTDDVVEVEDGDLIDVLAVAISRVRISEPKRSRIYSSSPSSRAIQPECSSNLTTTSNLSSESRNPSSNPKQNQRKIPSLIISLFSPKLSIYLVAIFSLPFILFQIQSLQFRSSSSLMHQNCSQELKSMTYKLQNSVTFLPLKDLRFSSKPLQGHTWFMSSTLDTHEKGEVQYQEFPSKGRILCLKGRNTHDGSQNSYALSWPQSLPFNATFRKGLTFVSYNHYNYDNIWHGLSAIVPFVSYHIKNQCSTSPSRWVLYHWGELRTKMGPWLSSLMEAMFEEPLNIEKFDGIEGDPTCFEKAVVMRHNEGGMSREKRLEVYDLLRCKARIYCNVSSLKSRVLSEVNEKGSPVIGMTMFMRTGARSFKNESAVIRIFEDVCRKVKGCRSVMEFFPTGWLKLAGVGQYVYHWIASWSGMNHRGAWRDPGGVSCPFPEDDRRCMSIYKSAKIGYSDTYFPQWGRKVLLDVKLRKEQQQVSNKRLGLGLGGGGRSTSSCIGSVIACMPR